MVNFDVTWAWYTYLPIISWFFDDDLDEGDSEVVTYEFDMHGTSLFPSSYNKIPNFGFVNYAISQDSMSKRVLWKTQTLMDVVSKA